MTASTLTDTTAVSCPECGGRMYDNRATKKNPKAPDFKCKNRACDGVIWPPKDVPKKNGGPPVVQFPVGDPLKKPTMREAYKQLTEWVISDIVPLYDTEWGEGVFPPEATAAIVATLFIQACKAGKVE